MARDDLDAYVNKRTHRDEDLPELVAAAEARQAIARQLAGCRERAKLSQTQVAARMSTSASVVSRIERGADVQFSTIQKYAAALDLIVDLRLSAPSRRSRGRAKTATV
ncbi:MAG: helix-turn-helix transcriptional regulator [Deltaproteobacteria bacterium]|nr:helix-turn-helix transcriptional regulator [Deltaproteobacteria bacterium]